ncbi:hypothetical protein [Georgenia yuyongxinii]|uniref:Lipoprotein n=1 Tax=Georgenia yuyongxinii TaxID=2589797 RepID=A0A552WJE8_9MICO|nr:hypothetical protein [Georgenia yuyongxinii]TRW42878.1 hypothetical protein FJ693_19860 [Georgenia yuyongxinii]
MHKARTGVLGAAAVIAAGGLVAGCTAAATPEGWTRLEKGWLAVDVPKAWVEVAMDQTGPYDVVLQDTESTDDAQYQLAAATEFGTETARATMGTLDAQAPFGALDGDGGLTELDADGDLDLWRWDFTFDDGAYQGVSWAAHDPATERTVVVHLTGQELPEETVQHIEDSIEVLTD